MFARRASCAYQLRSVALAWVHPLMVGRRVDKGRAWRPPPVGDRDEPKGPTDRPSRDARMARVEAVLFLAREPLGSRRIAQVANLADGTEARTLIRRLNRFYDEAGRAFRAEEVAGGFQLHTRPEFGRWLRPWHRPPVAGTLSAPAMETLAVVAYRQPVLRVEIEAIRGVACSEMLRQLMDRELIRIVGRAEELGRPFLYGTTRQFLQTFGLRHLDDLPRADFLRSRRVEGTMVHGSSAMQTIDDRGVQNQESDDSREEFEVSTAVSDESAPVQELEEQRTRMALQESASLDEDDDFDDEDLDDDDLEDDDLDDDDFEDEDEEDDDLDDEWEEVDDDEEDEEEDDEEWDEDDEEWDDEDDEDEEEWDDE